MVDTTGIQNSKGAHPFAASRWLCTVATLFLWVPNLTYAEGVVQMGFGQDLLDYEASLAQGYALDAASASVYVDILAAGEVINVSLCGNTNADDITVEFYAPSNNS